MKLINEKGRIIYLFFLLFLLVGIDQVTKFYVSNHLNHYKNYRVIEHIFSLEYLENTGVAFGMMSGKIILISATVIFISCLIIYFVYKIERALKRDINSLKHYLVIETVCIFILAGAIGNFIDRIRFGFVIDFIKFDFIKFPTFNIADIYVTLGAFVIFVLIMFFVSDEEFSEVFNK